MTPKHFLLQFKSSVKFLFKLSFKSRRKPRPPPTPTTGVILPDPQDGTRSLEEKEYTFSVDLEPKMWQEILSYCEVIDIIHVGMVHQSAYRIMLAQY